MASHTRMKDFEFNYKYGNKNEKVMISVPIPLSVNIQEWGSCLISQKKIPFFVEKGEKNNQFISSLFIYNFYLSLFHYCYFM